MSPTRPVPFPPLANPRKPRIEVPPGSWDTHFHVYGPPDLFPYVESRRFTPCAAPIEHWLMIAAALGIERGVVVQPSIHSHDPAVIVDALQKADGRLRAIVKADPELSPQRLRELHAAGVRGVRFSLASFFGARFDADNLHRTIAAIEPLSWVATLLLDGDMVDRHAELIRRIPLPTVLDALGGVDVAQGVDQPSFRTLRDLAALPHVWVKLIGVDRSTAPAVPARQPAASRPMNARYSQYVDMARALCAIAPERIIWGTDWPHSEIFEPGLMPDDGDLLDRLLDFAPDPVQQRRILADNPKRLFDF